MNAFFCYFQEEALATHTHTQNSNKNPNAKSTLPKENCLHKLICQSVVAKYQTEKKHTQQQCTSVIIFHFFSLGTQKIHQGKEEEYERQNGILNCRRETKRMKVTTTTT